MASIHTQSAKEQRPENKECFDCLAQGPTWMDLWKPEQIARVASIGNRLGKLMYETSIPEGYGKPGADEVSEKVFEWLKVKYIMKKYFGEPEQVKALIEAEKTKRAAESSDDKKGTKVKRRGARRGDASPTPSASPPDASPKAPAKPQQPAMNPAVSRFFGADTAADPAPVAPAPAPAAADGAASLFERLAAAADSGAAAPAPAPAPAPVAAPAPPASASPLLAQLAGLGAAAAAPAADSDSSSSADTDTDDDDSNDAAPAAPAQGEPVQLAKRERRTSFVNLMAAVRDIPATKEVEDAAAAAAARAASSPGVTNFLQFDESTPAVSASPPPGELPYFMSNGGSGGAGAGTGGATAKRTNQVLDMFTDVAAAPPPQPTGPPPIGGGMPGLGAGAVPPPLPGVAGGGGGGPGGMGADEIARKIHELKMQQQQLQQQLAGAGAAPGAAPPAFADPFASVPAPPQQAHGGPPPIGGGGMRAPMPMHSYPPHMTSSAPIPAPASKKPAEKDPFADLLTA